MFEQPELNKPLSVKPKLETEIFVMPSGYYAPPTSSHKILLTGLGLLIVAAIGGVAYWYGWVYQQEQLTQLTANNGVKTNLNTNFNRPAANLVANTNTLSNFNSSLTNNTNTEINSNINSGVNENLNTNVNINSSPQPLTVAVVPASQDSDNDNLTDAEEALFKADPLKPDTDGDGYLDGAEVINGFSPILANQTLVQAGLAQVYTNNVYHYSLIYPSTWEKTEAADGQTISFSAPNGETLNINVQDNPENISALAWYYKLVPGLSLGRLERITTKELTGVASLDGLIYYLSKINNEAGPAAPIFIASESIGVKTEADFKTSLLAVVNSLRILPSF